MSGDMVEHPLNELQVQVLKHLLSVQFRGVEDLRRQLDVARVSKYWGKMSASFDISVPSDTPGANLVDGPAPIRAHVMRKGDEYLGELILWVTRGRISALEYAWYTDVPPIKLPEVREIAVIPI